MIPAKQYMNQYGFSGIVRLSTEIDLYRMSEGVGDNIYLIKENIACIDHGRYYYYATAMFSNSPHIYVVLSFQITRNKYEAYRDSNGGKIDTDDYNKAMMNEFTAESAIIQNRPNCPDCGEQMVWVTGPYGDFYGCKNFKSKNCRCKANIRIDLVRQLKESRSILERLDEER